MAGTDEYIVPYDELCRKFSDYPHMIQNTKKIADDCNFSFDFKSIKNKKTYTGSMYDDKLLLEKLAYDGLKYRYGENHRTAPARVKKGLDIIDRLGFSSYFLITADIIRYSMQRGYYHVGRGSGANSVVAYCLNITNVCPVELDLYFERFLNPRRKSPPDFDIDYSWKERDDVLEYIFKRYGKEHTALLGAMSTFRDRSIIREMGKVYGLPKEEIDRLIKYPTSQLNENEICRDIQDHFNTIEDFPPRSLICTLQKISALKNLIYSARGGIGHIRDAADIIHMNRGLKVDVNDVKMFKTDERVKKQLRETYGVMVYQEDVLKVGHHFGGLDLAEADVLRRMMSGKYRNRKHLDEIAAKYFANCRDRGYTVELSSEVWRQIESFAGYSFSKAHSASYAVESYQSLYLKTYFPMEFMVAVINNFGGFYPTRVYVNEARRSGASIHLPCVNRSLYFTTIYDSDIYLGFVHLKSLETGIINKIITEREAGGHYRGLEDFILRVNPGMEALRILIRIDALRFTGMDKRKLLWESYMLFDRERSKKHVSSNIMFTVSVPEWKLPALVHNRIEDAYDEIELLEFPVTMTEFDLLKTSFRGECMAKDMALHNGKKVRMLGNYVAHKWVRTIKSDIMAFGTFLDEEGNFFDTVHFPQVLKAYPFAGTGVYLVLGKVVADFGFYSIEAEKMAKLEIHPDPRVG